MKSYNMGQHIVYVDQYGKPHDALVTIWWGATDPAAYPQYVSVNGEPGCNLVLVSGDKDKDDPYGRQIERQTSVVHKTRQPAHGNFWCWPEELPTVA